MTDDQAETSQENVRSLADRSDDFQALLAEFTVARSADSRPTV